MLSSFSYLVTQALLRSILTSVFFFSNGISVTEQTYWKKKKVGYTPNFLFSQSH